MGVQYFSMPLDNRLRISSSTTVNHKALYVLFLFQPAGQGDSVSQVETRRRNPRRGVAGGGAAPGGSEALTGE